MITNPFGAERILSTSGGDVNYFSLRKLADDGIGAIDQLPFSIRVLLEACLRNVDNFIDLEYISALYLRLCLDSTTHWVFFASSSF